MSLGLCARYVIEFRGFISKPSSDCGLDLPYIYSTEGKIKEPNLAAEAGQGLLSAVSSYARGDMVSMKMVSGVICPHITSVVIGKRVQLRFGDPEDGYRSGLSCREEGPCNEDEPGRRGAQN